jgi:hypothetical protein
MKKALSIILIAFFAISCGGSSEPSTDNGTSGTDGSVDTLQPIYDSLQRIEDSLILLDTNNYVDRFGRKIQK